MVDERPKTVAEAGSAVVSVPLSPSAVDDLIERLAAVGIDDGGAVSDTERIDLIGRFEALKASLSAAQARLTAGFDSSQRQVQADAGVPTRRQGEGVASQVALARRESPVRGAQHLGLAKALVHEMPGTLAAMTRGRLSEWRATLIARETACVSREDRATIDATLTADLEALEGLGDRKLVAEARRLAYRLDPESVVRRNRKAEVERCVTIRPAPDTMTYLTCLLPVAQGVAAYAALTREADSLRAAGDPRSRGQAMADTVVTRLTGQRAADEVPLSVGLLMTDRALLAGDDEPAEIEGYGVVPAAWARELLGGTASEIELRRLYTAPRTGDLVAMDAQTRRFPDGLASLIDLRDRGCRTPWCDAPIRHRDHVVPQHAGGPTSAGNGQGLCERCNHAKEALGWRSRPRPGPRHTVEVTTPTGHRYRSTSPPMPGTPIENGSQCRVDFCFADVVLAA